MGAFKLRRGTPGEDDQSLLGALIPAPIGGVPAPLDYVPSYLFVALYALLVPVAVYRICAKRSRNLIVIFTLGLIVERLVFFILRAWAARASDAQRASPAFLAYGQSTLAAGYISIGKDLVGAVRCLLIRPDEESDQSELQKRPASDPPPEIPSNTTPDQHTTVIQSVWRRRWVRWPRMTPTRERMSYQVGSVCLSIAFIFVIMVSLGSGGLYAKVHDDKWAAGTVQMRYLTGGLGLLLITIVHMSAYWAWTRYPAMGYASVSIISTICTLLTVVGVYRLVVMDTVTNDLLSTGPGSLNSHQSKATFYIFHVAPEWMAVAILLGVNVRRRFGAGGAVRDASSAVVVMLLSLLL